MLNKIIANREARKAAREQDEIQRKQIAAEQQQRIANDGKDAARDHHGFQELKSLQQEMDIETFEDGCFEEYQVIFPLPCSSLQEKPIVSFASENIMMPLKKSMQELGLEVDDNQLARHAILSGIFADFLKKGHLESPSFIGKGLFTLLAQTSDLSLGLAALKTLVAYYKKREEAGEQETRGLQGMGDVPSATTMVEAFIFNGYDRQRAAARYKEANSEGNDSNGNKDEKLAGHMRTESFKLILESIVPVCEYCTACPAAKSVAFAAQDTSRLVLVVLHLFLEPTAHQLFPSIIPACDRLLSMYGDDNIWKDECAGIAREVVSSLYPTKRMQTRLVKMLDLLETPRALQLQQTVACVMLQKLIPTAEPSLVTTTQQSDNFDDVAKILSSLSWWKDGKSLIVHNRDDFSITDVELLLILCDVLLWPNALEIISGRAQAAGPLLDSKFRQEWFHLLRDIRRNIKSLKLEHKSVQTLADRLDLRYQEVLDV